MYQQQPVPPPYNQQPYQPGYVYTEPVHSNEEYQRLREDESQRTEKFQSTSWRDPFWALLFGLHVIVVGILCGVNTSNYLSHKDDFNNPNSTRVDNAEVQIDSRQFQYVIGITGTAIASA
eukprot:TRINITY_DN12559_c0_g2_i1.p1 TRINITY_DN12559_c0_g2~~TRINITY_DN12559_c0_g2_i1.p1  ORF type:complete len:120 (+),score=27.72 TRINITY_DN12559_c0_g2_i1:3-362(+)